MATIVLPHRDRLHQLLRYEPETGELFWKERALSEFANNDARIWKAWNTANAGKPALSTIGKSGYARGTLGKIPVQAHRVIWKLMTGQDANQVDHIDGVRSNNAWVNLRDVDSAGNRRNTALHRSNKSGVPGVMLYKRWECSEPTYWVRIGSKTLGYFKDFNQAVSVRKQAEVERGYHENHGRPNRRSTSNIRIASNGK